MKFKTLAAAACLLACSATSSRAATFNFDGTDYDFSIITGSYLDNQDRLESQFWFGEQDTALEVATLVGTALEFPNTSGEVGPGFVYTAMGNFVGFFADDDTPTSIFAARDAVDSPGISFAVATRVSPVPLPAGALLLLTGMVGMAGMKRRKKRTA